MKKVNPIQPAEQPVDPLAERKKIYKMSRETKTWKLYEQWFFLDDNMYPYKLGPMTKGEAINLAIGMNRCQVYDQHITQAPPETFMKYSAKAKEEGENWFIEVSTNYTRTGQARPSRSARGGDSWMDKYLQQGQDLHREKTAESMESIAKRNSAPQVDPLETWVETKESDTLLDQFMKGD